MNKMDLITELPNEGDLSRELGEWYDSSALSEFRTCPQRYLNRHEYGLVASEGIQSELTFGTAIHAALETVYRGTYAERESINCEFDTKDGTVHRYAASFLNAFPPNAEYKERTRLNGLRLLATYLKKFPPAYEPFSVEGVEQTFAIRVCPSGADPFWMVGRIDLIVNWSGPMPLDHKTTGRFGEVFEGRFRLDLALTTYMVAVALMFKTPVLQACVNGLRITEKITEEESFIRKFTTRTPEHIRRWEQEVCLSVAQIREARKTGFWPQYAHSCYAYMRECPYRCMCISDEGARAQLRESAFTVQRWEPL